MTESLENIFAAGRDDDQEVPVAMTVAGSDSGGGAGIQADLKTFAACRVHGTSVLTLVTAQNTRDVSALELLPLPLIQQQFESVVGDLTPAAAKTGALGHPDVIRTVGDCFQGWSGGDLVVDPVMISKHGDPLMPEDAQPVLRDTMLQHATLVTPNRHEAEALAGRTVSNVDSMKDAAKRIFDFGPEHVLIKGSHLEGVVKDILYDGTGFVEYGADRIDTKRLHGSGCVYSSAITARLAAGEALQEAVGFAREFITRAIASAPQVGSGINPVNPMHRTWSQD